MSNDLIDVKIEIKGGDLVKMLNRLNDDNARKSLMEALGFTVAEWGRDRIENGEERGPDGRKWEPLSPATLLFKKKKGKAHLGTLQYHPKLLDDILCRGYTRDEATVGSNLPYALLHQKGGMAGKNRKVRIPARPYLGLSEGQKKLLEVKVTLWFEKQLEG